MVVLFILIENENEDGEASFSRLIKLTCGGHVPRAELCTAAAVCVWLLGKLRYKHVGLSGFMNGITSKFLCLVYAVEGIQSTS